MIHKRKTENGERKIFQLTLALLLCGCSFAGFAQNKTNLTKEEIANYEVEIGKMMNYLQETFNFIGDPEQTAQEKEIIFTQSYTKIFQDDKVQIEDDLDPKRSTALSKDVQAYLKDIDFFFKKASFKLDVQSIAKMEKADGTPYFKVTLNRKLVGNTVTNDSINEVKLRYIEINLDKKNNDLKIASIYTTKVNEKEALRNWWNAMPSAWKNYLGKDIKVNDTMALKSVMQINEGDFIYTYPVFKVIDNDTIISDWKEKTVKNGVNQLYGFLKQLSNIQTIDVSDTKTITTLEPLSEISDLVSLNITGTNVNDLTPLRNSNKLSVLKAGNTRIDDLTPLKYDLMLEELDVSSTDVSDLAVLEMLPRLEKLNISFTQVNNLKPLTNCPKMTYLMAEGSKIQSLSDLKDLEKIVALNISNTSIRDLSPISNLKSLQSLKISNTGITHLEALQNMNELKELYCSNTRIRDLHPLKDHRRLSKIYCDNTRIGATQASEFSKENPFTLVIYDTNALEEWWENLPIYWKAVFTEQIDIEGEPSAEQLHEVINMTELDLSNNPYVQNLIPVSRLTNLVNLDISNTEITHLEPLKGMTNLEHINLENTYVNNLEPLAQMNRLKVLNINNTPIHEIACLGANSHLNIIWAENSHVSHDQVRKLKTQLPEITIVYQTEALQHWWDELDEVWRNIFMDQISSNSYDPSPLQLQRIVDLKDIDIDQENSIQSLEPIRHFFWLEKVNIANQGIRSIEPLDNKSHLSELLLQNNPISDLRPLAMDTLLSVLNIENTQVADISPLENLIHLRTLNASGTAIKSIKPLAKMMELEELLINNTDVKSISPIENIPTLKTLKIYNTKVKSKSVNALQQKRFDMNIVYY